MLYIHLTKNHLTINDTEENFDTHSFQTVIDPPCTDDDDLRCTRAILSRILLAAGVAFKYI